MNLLPNHKSTSSFSFSFGDLRCIGRIVTDIFFMKTTKFDTVSPGYNGLKGTFEKYYCLRVFMEFFLNGAEPSLNSVNSGNLTSH